MATDRKRRSRVFARIYEIVRMVPPGTVATYGQIAEIVGDRHAARTVGWALNALNEGTDVPWHRVINARGEISTHHSDGETLLQRVLLEREGIAFDERGRTDLAVYQWEGLEWPEIEDLLQQWDAEPPEP